MDVPQARLAVLACCPPPDSAPVEGTVPTPPGLHPSISVVSTEGGQRALWLHRGAWPLWPASKRLASLQAMLPLLVSAGVSRLVGVGEVRAIDHVLAPGDFITPSDVLDYTRAASRWSESVAEEPPAVCADIRLAAQEAWERARATRLFRRGIYGSVDRLPTAAEVTAMARDGVDVVGLAMGLDLMLAQSLRACFAGTYIVTGYASGVVGDPPRPEAEMDLLLQRLSALAYAALDHIPAGLRCPCQAS